MMIKFQGFGFVEFKLHFHALTALKNTNNKPGIFPSVPNQRLAVEFALENSQVLLKREKRRKSQKKFIVKEKFSPKASLDKQVKNENLKKRKRNSGGNNKKFQKRRRKK